MEFDIRIRAFERDGKIIFQAIAEKEPATGQYTIWADSPYIEDALKELGREIKRSVYDDALHEKAEVKG